MRGCNISQGQLIQQEMISKQAGLSVQSCNGVRLTSERSPVNLLQSTERQDQGCTLTVCEGRHC